MSGPTHMVIETRAFTARLDWLGVTATERATIYDIYSTDPGYGSVVRRTGGLRKGRVAKDDTGKSGGYRIFSFFATSAHPAFLIWIVDKTKDASLTAAQDAVFRTLVAQLKKECR